MKCFYHRVDYDGKCSGAIVKMKHPDCELIGIDYGDQFPWDLIHEDDVVWMVDFCLQPFSDMVRLKAKCRKLIWIDHHKTAIEAAELEGFECEGVRCIGLAGCESTWNYTHSTTMPSAVYYLGRYDVWDHKNPNVLPFQFGIRLDNPLAVDVNWWHEVFCNEHRVTEIVKVGQTIQKYQEQSHAGVCQLAGFDLRWEGLRWTVINGPYRGSMVHKSRFDPAKHDAMLGFYWTGSQWMFSLSTDRPDIDVSAIAKKYGGGGHRGAAGFQADRIPFELRAA